MSEEMNTNNAIETTEVKKEATKKVRKSREKVRSAEECLELPVTKLTDKEKNNLIKELKEALTQALNQSEAYKTNARSAFDKCRQMEDQYKAMEQYYKDQLKYVDAQVNAFHSAINQAVKGGIA